MCQSQEFRSNYKKNVFSMAVGDDVWLQLANLNICCVLITFTVSEPANITGPPATSNVSYGDPVSLSCSPASNDSDVSIEWTIDGGPISDLGYASSTCVDTVAEGCVQYELTINTASIGLDNFQETMNISCTISQDLSSIAEKERMNNDMLEVRLPDSTQRVFQSHTELHIQNIPIPTTPTTATATTSPSGPSSGGEDGKLLD